MRTVFLFLAVAILLIGRPASAASPDTMSQMHTGGGPAAVDGVMVKDAWARASAGEATTGAAYVTLTGGAAGDKLVGVSSPVAGSTEVHESSMEGGVMRMRAVPALTIPPQKTVTFKPGGYHIMMMDLHHPLQAGQSFPLTLKFEHAAPKTVDVSVRPIGAAAVTDSHDHMQMK